MESRTKRIQTVLIYVALATVTLAAYWQVLHCDFTHYDDDEYVGKNRIVQQGLTWSGLHWALTTKQFGYRIPLTGLSHMLDCQLFGLNASAHHLTSLLFHIANTLLVFTVLMQMTTALWRSALVAALFGLHPLHVESVAWIAERKDVLSTFFWLLTMLAYARYAQFKTQNSISKTQIWYGAALLLFALGLMSKPMVVTLPCVLLLMDYWPLRRVRLVRAPADGGESVISANRWKGEPIHKILLEKVPFVLLAIPGALAARGAGHIGLTEIFPWSFRFATVPIAYTHYLLKMFWPDPLAVLYPMPSQWPIWQVVLSSILVIAISAIVLRLARSHPYLLFGWAWYLGTLVPTIGLVPVAWHPIVDRYTYVPLIGVFVMIAWGAKDFAPSWAWRKPVAAVAVVAVLTGCGLKTWLQTQCWQNTRTLFDHAVRVTKNNATAHYNFGCVLLEEGDASSAMEHFRRAVQIKPNYDAAQNNLGRLLHLRGETVEAIEHYREALRINPLMDRAHFNLGLALVSLGRDGEAESHFAEAMRLAPGYVETHSELCASLTRQGKIREAIAGYREALRHCPNAPLLLNNLAWLLATTERDELRNGEEAIRLAERACARTDYGVALMIGTLAAAYAEAGRFAAAQDAAARAHALAAAGGETALAERNLRLLELYRAGKPYRETVERKN